ncbi:MAG: anthranilate synthase component I family protein [Bacteroidetes bacterium]|nr:MAG: anthranilate synthase component I family protein [Bacteroidota bacterium]
MHTYPLQTRYIRQLADTVTPVSIFLRLRDRFGQAILLESSDYHGNDNTYSFICFDPIAEFKLEEGVVSMEFPDGDTQEVALQGSKHLPALLQQFLNCFEVKELDFKFSSIGLFGYQAYDTVRHYEDIQISTYDRPERRIPDMLYHLYRYMIVINHFNNEMFLFEHAFGDEPSQLSYLQNLLSKPVVPRFDFSLTGEEETNFTDREFLEVIQKGKQHCQRGDVFQIVLSRRFSQSFYGDEFNVYRALRSINPSPYLFYCDYGGFKLMGSSPEAQLIIEGNKATIHPIAGTFRRTGNDTEDARLARELFDDPKENAEHVMLVDLARNDLSRNGSEVKVETFKEIQFYSHVIHLVSKVTATIDPGVSSMQLVADTFPAGTLSGAPKHRAMQLIEQYEAGNRGFYGGCIGYLGLNGNFNQAIMIRSFLSKGNKLFYQAGAGIVSKSVPESELQEVHNKLAALRKALYIAHEINKAVPQQ